MTETVSVATADLCRQFAKVVAQQIALFEAGDASAGDEKRAGALLVLAKVLDSTVTTILKSNAAGAVDLDSASNGTGGLATGSKAGDTAELDRQLAQLVSNLVQAGKAE